MLLDPPGASRRCARSRYRRSPSRRCAGHRRARACGERCASCPTSIAGPRTSPVASRPQLPSTLRVTPSVMAVRAERRPPCADPPPRKVSNCPGGRCLAVARPTPRCGLVASSKIAAVDRLPALDRVPLREDAAWAFVESPSPRRRRSHPASRARRLLAPKSTASTVTRPCPRRRSRRRRGSATTHLVRVGRLNARNPHQAVVRPKREKPPCEPLAAAERWRDGEWHSGGTCSLRTSVG